MKQVELITQPKTEKRVKQTIDADTIKKLAELVKDDTHNTHKEIDHDGLEVPEGKIPLDGHFTAEEIEELVEMAKSEGILKNNVIVKVLEHNKFGDKVVIMEDEHPHKDPNDALPDSTNKSIGESIADAVHKAQEKS